MKSALVVIGVAALAGAWWTAPPRTPDAPGVERARAMQRLLGPLRAPAADALRLRASAARGAGVSGESIALQRAALELDPWSTASVRVLVSELAFDLAAGRASAVEQRDALREATEILRRARTLGNDDPELGDVEAFLLVQSLAGNAAPSRAERESAYANAIELLHPIVDRFPPARFHLAAIYGERALLRAEARDWKLAAADYRAAEQTERTSLEPGSDAAALVLASKLRAELCDAIGAGARADSITAAAKALAALVPDDRLLALAAR